MTLRMTWMTWLLTAVLAAPLIGCGDDDDDDHEMGDHDLPKDGGSRDAGSKTDSGKPGSGDDELEVAGKWTSDFGDNTISVDSWDGGKVVEFDNDDNVAFIEYPDDPDSGLGGFNKVVWTEPTDEGFYYCIVDFGLPTLAAAKATKKTADAEHPEEMGSCGSFTWTKLSPL